jgi:ABC-type multidrug transport system fused ATPase/permease subunit
MTAALQSDLVIVLAAGREVERGTPTSLLKVESHFAALVKAEREESERWMEAL